MPTHFALDDQIASQPEALRALRAGIDAPVLDPERPVLFSGIGTSLHACRVAAAWTAALTGGALRPIAVDAHDLALDAPLTPRDQVVVVSHRGTKRFPNAVLARARALGAATVAIVGQGAPAVTADSVVRTCPDERAGTHTVSYLTALAALGRIVAGLIGPTAASAEFASALVTAPDAVARTLALPAPVEAARRLSGREPLLLAGVGLDTITAQEAALKLKEGTYTWAEGLGVEFALHGPPAALRAGMGAITITPAADTSDGGRTQALRGLLHDLGVVALTCGDGSVSADEDLPFVPVPPLLRPFVAIVPLQRLTAELARLAGTNPDAIHRDIEPWASAMGRVTL